MKVIAMSNSKGLRSVLIAAAVGCGVLLGGRRLVAAEWPTHRGDARRSAYTAESLPAKLSLRWVYHARHAPCPAWSGRDTRMPFDRAYHPVIAGGALFFASSADCMVYALDAATGVERWTFVTGGPVRLAPAFWKDRVFVVSDDGFLYCLAGGDGRLLWKLRGGPDDDMVLGNDRMVSRWPARGGPVIGDGVVYFGAGIWPSEGIFIYAMDAESGKVLWCNDTAGGIYMGQPHGGANAKSGVSAQGNFVIAGDILLVPTGRAVPAAFSRADGKFLYFHLQENTKYGGSEILATEDRFFNGGAVFDVPSGARQPSIPPLRPNVTAASPEGLVHWRDGKVRALRWTEVETKDRKGNTVRSKGLKETWSAPVPCGGTSLLLAGQTVVSAGQGDGGYGVSTIEVESTDTAWSDEVDGAPHGLAVAGGRLFVSTDKGTVYSFDASGAKGDDLEHKSGLRRKTDSEGRSVGCVLARTQENHDLRVGASTHSTTKSSGADVKIDVFDKAAQEILRLDGPTEGYCLDLGCGDGGLAEVLARTSRLHVYAIDSDAENVARARSRLQSAGLYGVRVTVHQGDPADTPYPNYFADLVVSGRSVTEGYAAELEEEANRCLRPWGGVAVMGQPGAMRKTVRGPLEGAGAWTHQYCDPANTNCSTDTRVKGPLGMLWFTDFGFQMPSRHGRGRAPLFLDGRLFIEGVHAVLCVDAYNGRKLWEYPLPGVQAVFDGEHLMGASGTGSNLCIDRDALYVHIGRKCLRLDPATGKLLSELTAPNQPDGKPGTWGVIFCAGDTLLGTLADTEHVVTYRFGRGDMSTQFTESLLLFAVDAKTGELKWRYRPEHAIRHNAIAMGGGRVFLIDRPTALGDRHREKRRGVPDPGDVHPAGALVALDMADGSVLWKTDDDIFGTVLALGQEHETLVMCYQDWRFKLASELGGRMAAFDAATGKRRWDIKSSAVTRPIINGRTIYMQPGAWDLLTGEPKDFTFSRSYGCGIPAGSRHLMVFRSATLGYVDLLGDYGTENYGGIRPGCWINALPAGGLVLMSDATDRCTCSYLIKASVALEPYRKRPP